MAATANDHFMSAIITLGLLIMLHLDFTVAQTGICFGREGTDLPSASDVIAICNHYNIRRMRIYRPHQPTLLALRDSKIEVMLGVPNSDLESLAASEANAHNWVQINVRNYYPNVRFRYIAVGNEVSYTSRLEAFVLPALRNIYSAISAAGLRNEIRVSTAVEGAVLGNSFPPSAGEFRFGVGKHLNGIIGFLVNTSAPLLVNAYPFFPYLNNPGQVNLQYALLQPNNGVTIPDGGAVYENLLYAMLDAFYAAMEKSSGSSVEIVVSESGWPSAGGDNATNVENARIYNTNLIKCVKNGTPRRPGRPIEAYIFAMFDENPRNPDYNGHFGVFLPNGRPKYPINFTPQEKMFCFINEV